MVRMKSPAPKSAPSAGDHFVSSAGQSAGLLLKQLWIHVTAQTQLLKPADMMMDFCDYEVPVKLDAAGRRVFRARQKFSSTSR